MMGDPKDLTRLQSVCGDGCLFGCLSVYIQKFQSLYILNKDFSVAAFRSIYFGLVALLKSLG